MCISSYCRNNLHYLHKHWSGGWSEVVAAHLMLELLFKYLQGKLSSSESYIIKEVRRSCAILLNSGKLKKCYLFTGNFDNNSFPTFCHIRFSKDWLPLWVWIQNFNNQKVLFDFLSHFIILYRFSTLWFWKIQGERQGQKTLSIMDSKFTVDVKYVNKGK